METRARVRHASRAPQVNLRPAGPPSRSMPGIGKTVAFLWRRRMFTPRYWRLGLRYVWVFKIRNRHIKTDGFVFLDPKATVYARRGYGRLRIGKWVWIGAGNSIRCHEGNLRIGDRAVLGGSNTINCYLDIEIGRDTLLGDWIYICDFDHKYDDVTTPIRKQGIVKAPVKIGANCWIGEKATILRGVTVGSGSVVGSHALVNRDVPPHAVVGGVPARVLKYRGVDPQRK